MSALDQKIFHCNCKNATENLRQANHIDEMNRNHNVGSDLEKTESRAFAEIQDHIGG